MKYAIFIAFLAIAALAPPVSTWKWRAMGKPEHPAEWRPKDLQDFSGPPPTPSQKWKQWRDELAARGIGLALMIFLSWLYFVSGCFEQ